MDFDQARQRRRLFVRPLESRKSCGLPQNAAVATASAGHVVTFCVNQPERALMPLQRRARAPERSVGTLGDAEIGPCKDSRIPNSVIASTRTSRHERKVALTHVIRIAIDVGGDEQVSAGLHFLSSQMSNDIICEFLVIDSGHRAAHMNLIVRHSM